MKRGLQKGNGMLEGIVILAVILTIILISPKNKSGSSFTSNTASYSRGASPVSISAGNASSVYQPYSEYITINNRSRDSVNITGWQLKNGKGERAYDVGGTLRQFSSDVATIGQAAPFVSPYGYNVFQDVILKSGETAVVTSGLVGSQSPYRIVSFKENMCSGYLEDLSEYAFIPPLSRTCVRPSDEPGVSGLDTACRKFIGRMASCHKPEFDTRDRDGEICSSCADGELLSSACIAFIKNHFNYTSCIANHSSDQKFSGKIWRIFLGRGWEMWAKDYETINLFDQSGKLVESISY